jgi:hypothetical protein
MEKGIKYINPNSKTYFTWNVRSFPPPHHVPRETAPLLTETVEMNVQEELDIGQGGRWGRDSGIISRAL